MYILLKYAKLHNRQTETTPYVSVSGAPETNDLLFSVNAAEKEKIRQKTHRFSLFSIFTICVILELSSPSRTHTLQER